MKKLITYLLIWTALPFAAQNKVSGYRYWFDEDFANVQSTTIPPVSSFQLNTTIDGSSLIDGLHVLNFQFQDENGDFSSVLSRFITKLPISSVTDAEIVAWEYWFDNDHSSSNLTNISATDIYQLNTLVDGSTLIDGLHVLNFRFKDNMGNWSSVLSRFVTKSSSSAVTNSEIVAWEYWFDNDHSSSNLTSITATDIYQLNTIIDGNSLINGLHVLNFRFKDNQGNWSSVLSRFVTKTPNTVTVSNNILEWEYWFDTDYASVVNSNITPTSIEQLNTIVDGSSLLNGLHVLNIRFKDENNHWSSVLSKFVTKTPNNLVVSNQITQWEYWFDNDYTNVESTPVTPNAVVSINDQISGVSLNSGLHILNVRFKDENNFYSSVLSKFVIKRPITTVTPNLITSYRYWFNDGDSAMIVNNLSSPTSVYQLTAPVSMAHLPKGDYQINFQFKDTLQQWSSVLSDSVYKNSLPVALFDGDTLNFCDSAYVQFNDMSIDANEWLWTFGDGGSSTDQNPSYQYTTSGFYDVTLTVSDSVSGLDSTLTFVSYVNSFATPDPTIATIDNDSICFGSEARLVVDEFSDVLWSTNEINDTIVVATEGWYYATLSNPSYTYCTSEDSVYVTVMPELIVDLGVDTSICDGNSLTLNAPSADSWLWSTTESTQSISVSTSGIYFVDIYDVLGCSKRDSITLGINPLAVADFSYTASLGDVDFTSLSSDAIDFDWSFDDGNTSIDEHPSNSYLQDGTYHVCLTVSNDCNSDVYCEDILIQGLEIEDISSAPLMTLYPNPVIDDTQLIISGNQTDNYEMKIYSSMGQLVLSERVNGSSSQTLELSDLPSGNYFLELSNGGITSTIKFVKLR